MWAKMLVQKSGILPDPGTITLPGIWPVGYDGTDINSVCRSHDSRLVATADDFGLVNLFRYPCCNPTVNVDHPPPAPAPPDFPIAADV